MSEDLTKKLPQTESEKQILTALQNLDTYVRTSFDQLVTWVGNIDSRLQRLEAKVERLEQKVERLDEKVEQRLYDTRPIWHKVVGDIAQLQTGQEAIRAELSDLHNTVREINRDQIVINDSLRKIQLDFHNIDQRLYRLEVNRITPN
jgi:chromosome segregation ATPase